ncbi:MAG: CRISPR type III-associated RAMP protein Csm3 [Syntrophomonadaceae bacterium]|nr:CRISPR type III-associated RAMP protein Csm3 [Bacillota bacterium]
MSDINLLGKIVITGTIEAETGLHIGGATTGLDIGGVDNSVIKDSEGKPYIPGSTLKGKMRSLLERDEGLATAENRVWVKKNEVSIHMCNERDCVVCNIFGRNNGKQTKVTGGEIDITSTTPTRLIVRDGSLVEASIPEDVRKNLDLEWTEVKWENVIDRITSAANPRQTERVPAGAKFEFGLIYNVFNDDDKENLKYVFKAIGILEDDYLGGQGTRGYGRVKFENIKVYWNSKADYESGAVDIEEKIPINDQHTTPSKILKNFPSIQSNIQ